MVYRGFVPTLAVSFSLAIQMNVASVKQLLALCHKMKRLQVKPRQISAYLSAWLSSFSLSFMSPRPMRIVTATMWRKSSTHRPSNLRNYWMPANGWTIKCSMFSQTNWSMTGQILTHLRKPLPNTSYHKNQRTFRWRLSARRLLARLGENQCR
jgi:hypothetical protein